ncbi:MAG TPA: ABC transporter permease [Gemmatimonadales bacterium]|nr:ABC transporter permease [Gemmatimonadales bacterium]
MDGLLQDLRYALRSLGRSPGFAGITLLTLALGIGANTAIFSVVNAVLLRPLPFLEPDRLVRVRELYGAGEQGSVSGPNFLDWRARNHVFERMTASRGVTVSLLEGGEPEEVQATAVTVDFFRVLGVAPAIGRGFVEGEDQGEGQAVVLGDALWRTRFGADPAVVGRAVNLSGRTYTVIGVAPPALDYPGRTQLWLPLGFGTGRTLVRDSHSYDVLGRLRPGVAIEDAERDLAAVARTLAEQYPESNTGRSVIARSLSAESVQAIRPALLMMSGAVGLVLLIACANVANLFLARAVGRQREFALRAALGARRWRLARQVLAEALLIAGLGGMLGVLLASWSIDLLVALQPGVIPRIGEVTIDRTALVFTLAVSLLVGVAFGVAPALAVSAHDPASSFRGEGRGTGGTRASRFRAGLVVAQLSLALVLVTGAALLAVSVRHLAGVALGFEPEGVVTFDLSLSTARYPDPSAQRRFVQRVLERVHAIPGVQQTGAVFFLPLGSGDSRGDVAIEGQDPPALGQEHYAGFRLVAGDYLRAMGLSARRGRLLGPDDIEGAPLVAVVNEALVRSYFGGQNPIGQRITFGTPDSTAEWRTIVGVVGDVRHGGLTADPLAEIYVPQRQLAPDFWSIFVPIPLSFVVRGTSDATTLAAGIKAAVRDVDPQQPVSRVRDAGELVRAAMARYRFNMLLLTLFGVVALTLASVGVYGVMAYTVSQRTREMGIRLALGAQARSVQALVLRQGLAMTVVGIGFGVLGALVLARLLGSLLYEVSPSDPRVLIGATLLLAGVSVVACLVPAVRATRVDPIEALRSE